MTQILAMNQGFQQQVTWSQMKFLQSYLVFFLLKERKSNNTSLEILTVSYCFNETSGWKWFCKGKIKD